MRSYLDCITSVLVGKGKDSSFCFAFRLMTKFVLNRNITVRNATFDIAFHATTFPNFHLIKFNTWY